MKTKLLPTTLSFFVSFFLIGGQLLAQQNIAPLATVTASSCQGGCSVFNDQNYGTCGTQDVWISTGSPPTSTPGVDWIQWDFTSPKPIDSLIIYNGYTDRRYLTGYLVQSWDGSSWINQGTITGIGGACISRSKIGPFTAQRFRITSFQMNGAGQTSNPSFREIEIISGGNGGNDAGITELVSPVPSFCGGTKPIKVRVKNFGINQINPVKVAWTLDNVPQTPITINTTLDTAGGVGPNERVVTLGNYNFTTTPVDFRAWTYDPNNTQDTINGNDTISRTLAAGLSGIYTINANQPTGGTNFNNFNDLADILNTAGVCGALTVNVVSGSGPYNEQVTFDEIPGASSSHTITINGHGEKLTYQANSSSAPHTLLMDGTDHMTINNLTIESTGHSYGLACHLTNTADSNNFNHCHFKVYPTATSSYSVPFSISGSVNSATGYGNNGNYNTIDHCTMTGGYYCVTLYGNTSSTTLNKGNKILNSRLEDFYLYGLRTYYQEDLVVKHDTVERPNRTSVSTFYGMYFYRGKNMLIEGNVIRNPFGGAPTRTSTFYGMYLYYSYSNATNPNRVYNNLIYNVNGNSTTLYGMRVYNFTYNEIYHNTIVLDNTAATSSGTVYGIYAYGNYNNYHIKNNLVSITRGGSGNKFGLYYNSSDYNSDYNDVYVHSNGGSDYYGYNNGANVLDLAGWQSGSSWGQHSHDLNPQFVDAQNFDFHTQNPVLIGGGEDLTASVPKDITGYSRPVPPTVGAFEYTGPTTTNNAGVTEFIEPSGVYCPGQQPVKLAIYNAGSNNITSLKIHWEVDGVPQNVVTYNQTLVPMNASGRSMDTVTLGNAMIGSATPTVIKAWTAKPNGLNDLYNSNDTLSRSFSGAMSGTYTLDAGSAASATNYQSFSNFANDLAMKGMCAPVILNVAVGSGPYNEQVSLPEVLGSSSTNTITVNGNGEKLTYSATSSSSPHTLLLSGTDYLTVNDLTIESTGSSYGLACHLTGDADYNTFNHCTFKVSPTATSSYSVPFSISGSANSAIGTGNSGSYNTLAHCSLMGGYYGVTFYGNTSAPFATGNKITNTHIKDFYEYGLYGYYQDDMVVLHDTIDRPTRTSVTTCYSTYFYYPKNILVKDNVIRNPFGGSPTSTSTFYGIRNYYSRAITGSENRYINNLIYDINGNSSTLYGLYLYRAYATEVYHNTIVLDNTASTGSSRVYGIYNYYGDQETKVENNIVYITRGGNATKYGLYYNENTYTSDYNDVYVNSSGGSDYFGYYSGNRTTLSAWQTGTSYGANSFEDDPQFVNASADDYHVQNTSIIGGGDDLTALVPFDFLGLSRPVPPTIGALEPLPTQANDAGSRALISPQSPFCAGTDTVKVAIFNNSTNDINSLEIHWKVNGVSQTTYNYSGTLAAPPSNNHQDIDTVTLGTVTIPTGTDINVEVWTAQPNNQNDPNNANDTVSTVLHASLSGTFTLNSTQSTSGTNYNTFSDFVDDLDSYGVCGPVILNIVPGTGPYDEQISIPEIMGASAINTITINGHDETLTYQASSSSTPWTLLMDGADHFYFNHMTIEATGSSYGLAAHLTNNADSNTFNYIHFKSGPTATSSYSVPFSISGTENSATSYGASGNYNTIKNSTMTGGYYGLSITGESSNTNMAKGNKILNCRVADFYFYGIRAYYQEDMVIKNDTVERPTRTSVSTFYGMYIYRPKTILVEGNVVRNPFGGQLTRTSAFYGIRFYYSYATSGQENKVINNVIYDINGNSSTLYGMYLYDATNTQFYHNSIVLDDSSSTGSSRVYGLYVTSGNNTVDIKNNIIFITRGGNADKYGLYYNSSSYLSDYNDVYVNSVGGTDHFGYNSGDRNTLSAWQSNNSAWGQHSLDDNPQFSGRGFNFGDLAPTNLSMDDKGHPVGVLKDFYGLPRSTTTPDIGAIEFPMMLPSCDTINLPHNVAAIADKDTVCLSDSVVLDIDTSYYLTSGLTYQWQSSLDQQNWTNIGSVMTHTDTVIYNVDTTTCFRLKILCHNSALMNSDSVKVFVNDLPIQNVPDSVIICGPGQTTLTGTTSAINHLVWYENDTAQTPLAVGNTFTTPFISSTDTFYVASISNSSDTSNAWMGHGTGRITNVNPFYQYYKADKVQILIKASELQAEGLSDGNIKAISFETDGGGSNIIPLNNFTVSIGLTNATAVTSTWATGLTQVYSATYTAQNNAVNTFQFSTPFYWDGTSNIIIETCFNNTTWSSGYPYVKYTSQNYTATHYGYKDVNSGFCANPGSNYYTNSSRPNVRFSMEKSCKSPRQPVYVIVQDTIVNAGILADTTICEGQTATLTAPEGDSYAWQPGQETTRSIQVSQADTYYVAVTDSVGCVSHFNATLTLNDTLTNNGILHDTTVCEGTPATLTAPAGTGYSWFHDGVGISNTSQVLTLSGQPSDSGQYTVVVTDNHNCASQFTAHVSILPTPVVDLGRDTAICIGDTLVLDAGNPGADYSWSISATTQTINVTTSDDYSVIITNGLGCSSSDTISVNFNPLPTVNIGKDTEICLGGHLVLDAGNPGSHYLWNTNAQTQTITVNSAGSYSVRVTDANGCSASDTMNLTVGNGLLVNLGNDTSICMGEVLTLDAGFPGSHYQWNTSETTQTIDVTAAGTYYVHIVTPDGCLGDDTIQVSTLPIPVVDLGRDTAICIGETLVLDAGNPGADYSWNTSSTTQTINVTSGGDYSVTVRNGFGCSSSDTISVNFNPIPTVNIGNDTNICLGAHLVLDAGNSGSSYLWSTGAQTQTITVNSAGSYSVRVTDANGCSSSDTMNLTVTNGLLVNLGNDTSICMGEVLTLDAGFPGSHYQWNTSEATQTIDVTTAGTYYVHIVTQDGCLGDDTIHVSTLSLPVVDLGNDTAICDGATLTLNAGNAGNAFAWSTSETTQKIDVTTAGDYSVTVTDGNGCSSSDTINLVVNSLPVVNIGNDTAFCFGNTITLDAGNVGSSYLWSTAETTQTINVNSSGRYSVIVTDANGCSSADSVEITVHALPVVSLGVDTAFCIGNVLTLDAGNVGSRYLWNTSDTTQTIDVTTTGIYSVGVTDVNGCFNSDTIDIIVNPLPVVNLGADTAYCDGEQVTLDAGNPGDTYLWNTNATTRIIQVSDTGYYWVIVTDSNNCEGADSIYVGSIPWPVVDLGFTDSTICEGHIVVLDAGKQPPTATFSWNTGESSQIINVADSGWYKVEVNDRGCISSDSAHISEIFNVELSAISALDNGGGSYNFLATGVEHAEAYHWDFGDGSSSDAIAPTHTYASPANYQAILTVTNDCSSKTTEITVHYLDNTGTGIKASANQFDVDIYPSPTKNLIHIRNNSEYIMSDITVYNMLGQKMLYGKVKDSESYQLNVQGLASGVYNIRIAFKNGNWIMRRFEVKK